MAQAMDGMAAFNKGHERKRPHDVVCNGRKRPVPDMSGKGYAVFAYIQFRTAAAETV